MTDTRFKWLVSAATIVIIAIAAMILLPTHGRWTPRTHEPKETKYVFIDCRGTAHSDPKCSRLNYKGVTSERVLKTDFSGARDYCPKCVTDAQYEELEELAAQNHSLHDSF